MQLDRPVEKCDVAHLLQSLTTHHYEVKKMPILVPEEIRIQQIKDIPNIEFLGWIDGYKNNTSKTLVRCRNDGFVWQTSPVKLLSHKHGCPQCAGNRRWTADEYILKINTIGIGRHEFVRWHSDYPNKNKGSVAICKCLIDGYEWNSTVNHLIHSRSGCPQCSGVRKWTGAERIEQINKIGEGRFEFIKWSGEFVGNRTRAIVRCIHDGYERSASVNNLVNNKTGCPACAKCGYDKRIEGTLYALISASGEYVKVGISNKPSRRHDQLRRATPFTFSVIEQVVGRGDEIADLENHFHANYKSAELSGFDGATEWLVCTDELIHELRNTRYSLNQGV